MRTQRGNFLLQALLALTLVFAFVPFLATRMASRNTDAKMYTATRQIETAQTAARIFIRDTANDLPYNITVLSGNSFVDTLEPYGLPLGFVPKTALGQDISLIISKDADAVYAQLLLTGGNLTGVQLAELARRIGFYAAVDGDRMAVGLALDDVYSDVVCRNDSNIDGAAFLTDLDMGGFVFDNGGNVVGRGGEFETAQFNTLTIVGTEAGRKEKNNIKNLTSDKAVFQSRTGESALSLTRGTLGVGTLNARTIAKFGDTGNFTSRVAAVYDFSMTAGRTSFTGPVNWSVGGNVVTDKINFTVERLDISSFINASRGQDVYINPDDLEYNTRSGIETDNLMISNITLRDQTSDALANGGTGAVVLDLRPAGTSLLPDVLIDGINNGAFAILASPTSSDSKTVDCKSIITKFDGVYNQKSLAQYLICQYVFWQRLESRINAKQCMIDGGVNCD